MKHPEYQHFNLQQKIDDVLNSSKTELNELKNKSLEQVFEELKIYHAELEFQNNELKRSNNEVERQKGQFQFLFNSGPFAYLVVDQECRISELNLAAIKMFNYLKVDLLKTDLRKNIKPKYQDIFHFAWNDLLKGKEINELLIEFRFGHCYVYAKQGENKDDFLISIVNAQKEIKAKKALENEEQRVKDILTFTNDIVFTLNSEGIISYKGANWGSLFLNYKNDHIHNYLTAESSKKISLILKELNETKVLTADHFNLTFKGFDSNDRVFSIRAIHANESIKDREFFELICIGRDVTREIQQQKSLEFRAQLLNKIGQPTVAVTNDNRITFWNHAAEGFFLQKANDVNGKSFKDVIGLNKKDKIELTDLELGLVNQSITGDYWVKAQNSLRLIRLREHLYYNSLGTVEGKILTILDITDLKQKETEITNALNLVTDQNNRLQEFSHIVSHNIRSHASNIAGLLNLFHSADSEDEKNQFMRMLDGISTTLIDTLESLVNIIGVQRETNPDKQEVKIAEAIYKAKDALSHGILTKQIKILHDFSDDTTIISNPTYFESIILNLISNSVKYADVNKDERFIKITHKIENNRFRIQIEDNGLGIDLKKYGSRLFKMYQTFHSHPEAKGIGLYLTKNQIVNLGGKIDVESQVGKGTKFTFVL